MVIMRYILIVLLSLALWDAIKAKNNYSALLASCMNGEALYDKTTKIAYFCSTAVEIQF